MIARWSLRTQLLASYVVLLLVSLGIIVLTTLVIAGSRPAPTEQTFQRLSVLVQGLAAGDTLRDILIQRFRGADSVTYRDVFDEFSDLYGVRLLFLTITPNNRQRVIYDSATTLNDRDIPGINSINYLSPRLQQVLDPRYKQVYGTFTEGGDEWLFAGIERTPQSAMRAGAREVVMIAEVRPTVSLQAAISDLTNSLLPVVIQAGAVGLVIAVVLAFLVSRGIVQPLRAVGAAASAVARGDFDQRVSERGPAEVRTLASAFNRMSAEVRASQQSQRDFMANVSHDLKTPLTSIQGYSQAIMDGAAKDPSTAAQVIYDEATRLNKMVVELTDLMRMQSGRLSLTLHTVDMSALTAAIGERLRVVAMKKRIELHVSVHPVPSIKADGDRLIQVMNNLLSNAIKFTPSGGDIWLTTRPANGGIEITVRDTGIGIAPEDLSRVFERFYQADKSRGPQRGTGLGLAISKEIIDAHGGTIRANSSGNGDGTTFTVWLPV